MKNVIVIVGPPGCGKTYTLSEMAAEYSVTLGTDGMMLVSLTRSAAATIARKVQGILESCIGTLHSHCYRLTGTPEILTSKHAEEWNAIHPQYMLSPRVFGTSSETILGYQGGTKLFMEVELLIGKCVPENEWDDRHRRFYDTFREFCQDVDACTFTDLLLRILSEKIPPTIPTESGNVHLPGVILADEVQDFSALEISILDYWLTFVPEQVRVGDPHQTIYEWRGASFDSLKSDDAIVLRQSYRVPKEPLMLARNIMERMAYLEPVDFNPTSNEGLVVRAPFNWKMPEEVVATTLREVEDGKTVMVIASCDYMLSRILANMRDRGVPFHNPYAPTNGAWNPLTRKLERGQISTVQRIMAYESGALRGHWDVHEMMLWSELFTGVWARGGKKRLKFLYESEADLDTLTDQLHLIFKPILFDAILDGNLARLEPFYSKRCESVLRYCMKVKEYWGIQAIRETPRITVGTIHSVKGGEADTVIVFPDLSSEGFETYQRAGVDGRDSVLRQFYVAVTRTLDKLIIASPCGKYAEI